MLLAALFLTLLGGSVGAQAPRARPAARGSPQSTTAAGVGGSIVGIRGMPGAKTAPFSLRPALRFGGSTPVLRDSQALPRQSPPLIPSFTTSLAPELFPSAPLTLPLENPTEILGEAVSIGAVPLYDSKESLRSDVQSPSGGGLNRRILEHAQSRGFDFSKKSDVAEALSQEKLNTLAPSDESRTSAADAGVPVPDAKRVRNTAFSFLTNMLTMQLGLEAMAWAVPQMAKALWDSFLSVSLISIVSMSALMLGSFHAGSAVDKKGAWQIYRKAAILRALSATALAGLYLAGLVGYPALLVLFGLDYYLHGRGRTGESALASGLYKSSPQGTQRFITIKQVVIDGIGIVGPLAAAWAFGFSGFTAIIIAYPILLGMSVISLSLGPKPEHAPEEGKPTISLREALKEIRSTPSLLAGSVVFAFLYAVMFGIYLMVAQSFGLLVAPDPAHASNILAITTSLYAAGGFLGTLTALALDAKRDKALESLPEDQKPAQGRRKLLRTAAFWTVLAAGGTILGLWSFLAGTPLFFGILPAYIAMPLFGFATTVASVQVESLITSEASQKHAGRILGVIRAASMAVTILGFLFLGGIFEFFSSVSGGVKVPLPSAFVWLGVLATAIGGIYLWAANVLRKASKVGSGLHSSLPHSHFSGSEE